MKKLFDIFNIFNKERNLILAVIPSMEYNLYLFLNREIFLFSYFTVESTQIQKNLLAKLMIEYW